MCMVQDPTERLYSSWKMLHRLHCSDARQTGDAAACTVPPLSTLTRAIQPSSGLDPGCLPYNAVRTPILPAVPTLLSLCRWFGPRKGRSTSATHTDQRYRCDRRQLPACTYPVVPTVPSVPCRCAYRQYGGLVTGAFRCCTEHQRGGPLTPVNVRFTCHIVLVTTEI